MAVNNILQPDTWDSTTGTQSYPKRIYYKDAFWPEASHFWGQLDFKDQVTNLCFYRMLTAFYGDCEEDVEDRRALLYYYMRHEFSTENSDDALIRMAHQLPIETFVPKALRNLCLAYKQPPARTWGTKGKPDAYNEEFEAVYREMHFDRKAKEIYKLAKLCNTMAVRPLKHDLTNKMEVHYIAPDQFRVNTIKGVPVEIYYQILFNGEDAIRVWDADETYVLDVDGNPFDASKAETDDSQSEDTTTRRKHGYGRIPFVFLQITPPLSNDFYGGGMFTLVEENLKANKKEFSANTGLTMNAFGVWVGTNTEMTEKAVAITPDKVVLADNVRDGEGNELPPHIEHVVGNSLFQSVRDDKRIGIRDALRNAGLPSSLVDENAGIPQSGISRIIERVELLEQRDDDKLTLAVFEQEFAELVALVASVDGYDTVTLPEEFEFNVDFAEEKVYQEPIDEYEQTRERAKNGDMSIAEYAREVMGIDEPKEEKIVEMIKERKELWKEAQGTPEPPPIEEGEEVITEEIPQNGIIEEEQEPVEVVE